MEVTWLQMALAAEGHDVDVITVRWQKYWPEKFVFRGSLIYRLPKPLSGPFGKYRFNKALSAHLMEEKYDGMIAFGLGDCLLYTSPSPRDRTRSRMPSSA